MVATKSKQFLYHIQVIKKSGRWYWRLKSRNGRILAHSEMYSSRGMARKTARELRNNLRGSVVEIWLDDRLER